MPDSFEARASDCPISQAFGDFETDDSVSGRACCSSCSSKGSDGTGLGSVCGFGVGGGLCKSSNSMGVIGVSDFKDCVYEEKSRISRVTVTYSTENSPDKVAREYRNRIPYFVKDHHHMP